ncbi:sodium-dependent transporter [Ferrimonas sp. SCSIO 43195]|uniref:sodium-dependent transporter n=1 Tax=Ferrimonas sp. SCSIO 43195 TaxID=2822844 RepID=UPI002075CF89|nr:sodium-dependent transporter [Ferrimonas sp. SCSIO 43195]USD39567.1 sodium-dependent transporter [Ferrimonas sp. SCSIO 43195]
MSQNHGQWTNRFSYVLAATGAAVGLGNIWKFPYIMGENGGGAFVLVYLVCIALIGIPVMMAEVMIGKFGRQTPAKSAVLMAKASGRSSAWKVTGWGGVLAGFLILSFYVVIAGWAVAYTWYGFNGSFENQNAEQIGILFSELNAGPWALMGWSGFIVLGTVLVVGKGVQKGLEKAVNYMMPVLFVLLAIMVGYAATTGNFSEAVQFMFAADFSKLSWNGVLIALGHSFFTLSLASGIMIMYGAYLPDNTSLVKTSVYIAIMDTLVALMAGLAIFPIVFANGLPAGAGPGLIFQSLPIAFGQMPLGQLFGGSFFLMVVVAAFTSSIALIESSVAWLVENRGFSRWQAAFSAGFAIWLVSLLTVFSLTGAEWSVVSLWGDIRISFFDLLDYITANIMLPLGGLIIAVFASWAVSEEISRRTLDTTPALYRLWQLSLRFVAPVAIVAVFLNLIGVLDL